MTSRARAAMETARRNSAPSDFEYARREAASLLRRIDRLDPRVLLYIHREVCRRAAPLYAAMYGPKQEQNYRAAMAALTPKEQSE